MSNAFLNRVARGPLLLDAAMGTRLIARGLDLAGDDPSLWNLTQPDAVLDVHQGDIRAGAEVIFANTFGANRVWLGRFGYAEEVAAINRAAVALARDAAGPARFVIGSIGPTARGHPEALGEQAEVLLEAGVDALALETFRLDPAVDALQAMPAAPILVGLFDWPESIHHAAQRLAEAGASIVGANCFADFGLGHRLRDVLDAAGITSWLKPSLGPHHSAQVAFEQLAARSGVGPGLFGGCCGATETHVATIRRIWDEPGRISAT